MFFAEQVRGYRVDFSKNSLVFDKNVPIEIAEELIAQTTDFRTLKDVSLITGFFNFSGVAFVTQGKFSISIPQQNMSVLYSYIVEECSWFGGLTLMQLPHPFLLIDEIEPVKLLFISKSKVIQLADANPFIYKWLLNMAAENIPQWFQAPLIAFSSKYLRTLYCLVTLLPINVKEISSIELNITQQELSNICGLSRPRVNEVLRNLETQNIVELQQKKIIILDIHAIFTELDEANLCFYDPRTKL